MSDNQALRVEPPLLPRRYEFLRNLGRGGMGQVYLARDCKLRRLVAIKRIAVPDEKSRDWIEREPQLTARVKHPNVVTVHEFISTRDHVFVIYEYIAGRGLDRRAGPLPWSEALRRGSDLAQGLVALHDKGVLHRDIKPSNAIVDNETGRAVLIDLGVARWIRDSLAIHAAHGYGSVEPDHLLAEGSIITTPGMVTPEGVCPGTPLYQAPEVRDKNRADQRSDIYSMGALLYELCTDTMPVLAHQGDHWLPLRLDRADVDHRFAAIVNRCLAIDPDDRFDSAAALADALNSLLEAPVPPENPYRPLAPFYGEHQELFFGRDRDAQAVVERLRTTPFLLLNGASGVGKSSLAMAGVLPRIHERGLGDLRAWRTVVCVPGNDPVASVARGIARDDDVELESLIARVRRCEFSPLADILDYGRPTVVFVDQLEELVTLCCSDKANRFGLLLAYLATQCGDNVRILAAVRGDYSTELIEIAGLGALIRKHGFQFVETMGDEAIRQAIVLPARRNRVDFEPTAMIDELIASTRSARGGLPLLQFALAEMWEAREVDHGRDRGIPRGRRRPVDATTINGVITRKSLDAVGGVEGALARHAENVSSELTTAEREAARDMLVELVTRYRTRARCRAQDLIAGQPTRRRVLDRLHERRLVVYEMENEDRLCSIAHEALLTAWPTLRRWLAYAGVRRELEAELERAATEWKRLRRPGGHLWTGQQLRDAAELDVDTLPELPAAFLTASRRARRLKRLAIVALVVLAATLVGAGYQIEASRIQHEVDRRFKQGMNFLADARVDRTKFLALRQEVMNTLCEYTEGAKGTGDDWEDRWKDTLKIEPRVTTKYRQATQTLQAALDIDPSRADVRKTLAEAVDERAQLSKLVGDDAQADELIFRLTQLDDKRASRWREPRVVALRTEPPGGVVVVRRHDKPDEVAVVRTEISDAIRLVPGSYVFTVRETDENISIHYPMVITSRATADIGGCAPAESREDVVIRRPRKADIPDGFVYVHEGLSQIGFGGKAEHEPYRELFETAPAHQRHSQAFLIARHETTYREWLEFATWCLDTESCRRKLGTSVVPLAREGALQVELTRIHESGWEFHWRNTGDDMGYRARIGETVRYRGRKPSIEQDWLQFPVTGISAAVIEAHYLPWLQKVKGVCRPTLCTEYQWERAARGADGRHYPHGDRFQLPDGSWPANIDKTHERLPKAFGPDEVGSHPASESPFGVHDLLGNVWEMTRSSRTRKQELVARGGSFFHAELTGRVFNSWTVLPDQTFPYLGFRVCADPPAGL